MSYEELEEKTHGKFLTSQIIARRKSSSRLLKRNRIQNQSSSIVFHQFISCFVAAQRSRLELERRHDVQPGDGGDHGDRRLRRQRLAYGQRERRPPARVSLEFWRQI